MNARLAALACPVFSSARACCMQLQSDSTGTPETRGLRRSAQRDAKGRSLKWIRKLFAWKGITVELELHKGTAEIGSSFRLRINHSLSHLRLLACPSALCFYIRSSVLIPSSDRPNWMTFATHRMNSIRVALRSSDAACATLHSGTSYQLLNVLLRSNR